MCQHVKWVKNPYTHQHLLVDCGKCPSCQQAKAGRRASRIRNNLKKGDICLFVTLTYTNDSVPYFRLSEIANKPETLYVYRDNKTRKVRANKNYDLKYKVTNEVQVLEEVPLFDYSDLDWEHDLKMFRPLKKKKGCVGVLFYKDLQDFFKRLDMNLLRKYGYTEGYSTFRCSEYGGVSHRPHFHFLCFIPAKAENTFRKAILESWPYGNKYNGGRFIEVAKDAASYVSSYVNGNNLLPILLQRSDFRQKHTYSKFFGMHLDAFSLSSIMSKIETGDLSYVVRGIKEGLPASFTFPIPRYVINRYFPKFKGYFNLTASEILQCIVCPRNLQYKFGEDYPKDVLKKVATRLWNCYEYFKENFNKDASLIDYAIAHQRVWSVYHSYNLKHSFDDVGSIYDYYDFYDNISDYVFRHVESPTLDELELNVPEFVLNPAQMSYRQLRDSYLTDLYNKCSKQKAVTNEVMANGLDLDV